MQIRNAYNLVVGEIPGAVLKGDGRLLNKDTINWAPWDPQVGSNQASLDMLRSATALRRGAAKPFLVYGRMLRPAMPVGIKMIEWQHSGQIHQIPAVFHSAWQSPDGHLGLVAANWTSQPQQVEFTHDRLAAGCTETISSSEIRAHHADVRDKTVRLTLPPVSCALVDSFNAKSL